MKKPLYITTTLPYVNADPHIGFALEIVRADALARYYRLLGRDVIFNTGTDEHGLKIHRKAEEKGISTQEYVDHYAQKFHGLKDALNLTYTHFIRTTDAHHKASAQEFWKRCEATGDIYKKEYQVKYCVGCELEKTDSELIDGKCEFHPTYEIEHINEENYFFRFSAYQEQLLALYDTHPDFVVPDHRLREIRAFVERGLQDFSISRLREKMPWGVPVPGDEDQVMYVWFDALVNYISTLGWPEDVETFERFWPGIQLAGKDNLRQQSAMWQAMLMSAHLPPSQQVFIGGFITSGGHKMSKSIGNVIAPYDVVNQYGTDPVRYYLLGALSAYGDGDWSSDRFEEFYTAHLVNGVGNLTSRVLAMVEKYADGVIPRGVQAHDAGTFWSVYHELMSAFRFDDVIAHIQQYVSKLDLLINETKPWEKAKNGEDITDILYTLAESLRMIALALLPIIPASAEKILTQLGIDPNALETVDIESQWGRTQSGTKVSKGEILFPRLENKQ